MTVPVLDLRAQVEKLDAEVTAAVRQVVETQSFILGAAVESFEAEFARYCNAKHCVALNSGTSALHLALLCLNVDRDDEVITVPMTFAATAWSISYVGATPVFVDIDPVRRTMDPGLIAKAITKRTRAIMPVHLYGMPADMDGILAVAERYGIPVVEDAAQAHGARFGGRRVGTFGRVGCFSFYPSKNLGGYGEGGALVTNDDKIAARARRLRDQGQAERYVHDEVGYNYRMDGIQGAVLNVKLKYLDDWNRARAKCATRYQELLSGLPCVLPTEPSDSESAWHLYVIETSNRDGLRKRLEQQAVQTGTHYPIPVHLQKAYSHLGLRKGMYPVTERLADSCVSLPLYPELREEQIADVARALHTAYRE